jgi:protein PET117
MHAGVERDIEKQRIKHERQADFEIQKRLEEEYRKYQNVSDERSTIADKNIKQDG